MSSEPAADGRRRTVRGRLPADLTGFVGRRSELAALARLLDTSRLVTVTGPGGVGKTRLALRAAAPAGQDLRDGVRLAEIGPVQDPLLLGHAVMEALELTDSTARPPLDVLVEQLADRRMLLVLDGCEHLVEACAELADVLLRGAPGLRVLATSRSRSGWTASTCCRWRRCRWRHGTAAAGRGAAVRGTGGGGGARVRADRGERRRRGAALPPAGRHPAGRGAGGGPAALALRGADRDPAGRPVPAADRRRPHRSAAAPDAAHHDRLEPRTVHLAGTFALGTALGVRRGFDLEAAEYVCAGDGIDPDAMPDLLGDLVDKSVLLRLDGGDAVRFRMLDTLREYGAQWLAATGEEQRLLRRHRDWYLGVATWGEVEWFGPRQAETAERTRLAHPNLRAALEFCLAEPGEEQQALVLAGTLWFYWVGSGHLGEGRHWLDRALALAPEPTGARAKALWVTGYMATLQGDLVRAAPALEERRRQALETGDDRALAYAVHRQGCAALIADDPVRAAELFEEALWHYNALGELNSNVLMAMFELGLARLFQGDAETGTAWIERVREICEEHGEQWAYAYGLYAYAHASWTIGELRRARAYARECVRLNHRFRDLLGIVLGVELLAVLETEGPEADLVEARVLQGAAHRMWQGVGTPFFGSRSFNGPHREGEERARSGLTEEEFEEAFARGAALDLDAAVRRALGNGGLPEPPFGTDGRSPDPRPAEPSPVPAHQGRSRAPSLQYPWSGQG
ncbi:ATP-binding protein [Kitasatospora arboriphila]